MQEYKEWDENVLLGPAPTIQNIHKGDIIKAMENDGDVGRETAPREYEVVEVYKRTVLTRDRKTGFRRCFSYGDLLTMKIERQDPGRMKLLYPLVLVCLRLLQILWLRL